MARVSVPIFLRVLQAIVKGHFTGVDFVFWEVKCRNADAWLEAAFLAVASEFIEQLVVFLDSWRALALFDSVHLVDELSWVDLAFNRMVGSFIRKNVDFTKGDGGYLRREPFGWVCLAVWGQGSFVRLTWAVLQACSNTRFQAAKLRIRES